MKIAFFHNHNNSLLTDFFYDFTKKLLEKNHDIIWFSFKNENKNFKKDGMQFFYEKKHSKLKNYITIYKFLKKHKPEFVIANFSYVNPAIISSYILKIKYRVIWFHTLKKQMDFSKKNIFIKSIFMKLSSHIIVNSEELKRELILEYKQNSFKLLNLPFTTNIYDIPLEHFNFKINNKFTYIGCPGRINKDKNQLLLLETIDLLSNPFIILVFAGGGDLSYLKDNHLYKKHKNQIIILGILNKNQMKSFYLAMDIIVLPSYNESFGLVFIESLALDCKTLVSNSFGSIDYIKNDINELKFNPQNKKQLAEKIINLKNKKYEKDYFRKIYLDSFSLDTIVDKFMSFTLQA